MYNEESRIFVLSLHFVRESFKQLLLGISCDTLHAFTFWLLMDGRLFDIGRTSHSQRSFRGRPSSVPFDDFSTGFASVDTNGIPNVSGLVYRMFKACLIPVVFMK